MNTTGVHGELREMWETRPARPRGDRQIAGVAAAIARRYDIDPVLVRVGFAAAAPFGIGGALYLLGWLVLPDTPRDPSRPEPRRRGILLVGLAAASVASFGSLMGAVFGSHFGILVPLLVATALLYLLHHSRAHRGVPGPGTAVGSGSVPGADAQTTTAQVSLVKGVTHEADEPVPPSWDPLGAAPFAWDLPEPGPATPPTPPRRRRPPVTAVTLGLALIAGAATTVILLATGFTAAAIATPILLGVVLSVLGLGLVLGAFLHAGRGLIPFAVLGSVLAWLALSAPLDRFPTNDGFGDISVAPTSVGQLQPEYRRTAGDVDVDLRRLDLSASPEGNAPDLYLTIKTGAGDATVLLPPTADVRFSGSSGLGDVEFEGRQVDGPGAKLAPPDDLGSDGVRQGRLLVINVNAGAGDVEVRRG